MSELKKVHIIGGGTITHVRAHLALAAPAYGNTAKALAGLCKESFDDMDIVLHLTKMADSSSTLETNTDVEKLVDDLIADKSTKVIIFNVALCDFNGEINGVPSGKYAERMKTSEGDSVINITPSEKLISKIRKERKDIFLVAFKTTSGATENEQYIAGLNLLKANSINLVLANDIVTRNNIIICPEEARYAFADDREDALEYLVEMTKARCNLTYTRSTVIAGDSVDWSSEVVPASLRTVVDFCIENGAYKTFRGVTAGHFAVKIGEDTFLTSKRKSNFNDLKNVGLVHVQAFGDDKVVAIGAKPSVGGQSQRIVFKEHPDLDCIVHFHCPLTSLGMARIPVRPQWMFECGSHECGQNTSSGLQEVRPGIWVVFLEEHGPNIVFNRNIDPQQVIDLIDTCFDLSAKTGGAVQLLEVSA